MQLVKFINKASLPIFASAAVACVVCIVTNLGLELIIFTAVVMLVAVITKFITSYIQEKLPQNSTVSTNLDNLNSKGPQSRSSCCVSEFA